eukprot:COSAG03_NODE_8491_length_797_cov_1.554441_1_plen_85_part_00
MEFGLGVVVDGGVAVTELDDAARLFSYIQLEEACFGPHDVVGIGLGFRAWLGLRRLRFVSLSFSLSLGRPRSGSGPLRLYQRVC